MPIHSNTAVRVHAGAERRGGRVLSGKPLSPRRPGFRAWLVVIGEFRDRLARHVFHREPGAAAGVGAGVEDFGDVGLVPWRRSVARGGEVQWGRRGREQRERWREGETEGRRRRDEGAMTSISPSLHLAVSPSSQDSSEFSAFRRHVELNLALLDPAGNFLGIWKTSRLTVAAALA